MKEVLSVLVLASTFAVTAYAGSGSESFVDSNASEYPSSNHVACVVQDKMITGVEGESCLYSKEEDNVNVSLDCSIVGEMTIDGDIGGASVEEVKVLSNSTMPSISINGYKFGCPA